MQLEKVRELVERKEGGMKRLAAEMGMTEQNFHRCIRTNRIQASELERLANMLGVDVRIFFDDNSASDSVRVHGSNNTAIAGRNITANMGNSQEEKIGFLEKLLAEKDAMIAEKERMIQMLLERK